MNGVSLNGNFESGLRSGPKSVFGIARRAGAVVVVAAAFTAFAGAQETDQRSEVPGPESTGAEQAQNRESTGTGRAPRAGTEDSAVDTRALAEELLSRAEEEDPADGDAQGGLSPGRQGQLQMFSAMLKELNSMSEEERQQLFRAAREFMNGRGGAGWANADEGGEDAEGTDSQRD